MIIVIGFSHKTTSIEVRELFSFSKEKWPELMEEVRREAALEEILLLSTCNRLEFWLQSGEVEEPFKAVKKVLGRKQNIDSSLYVKKGVEAVEHIFRVASGLDSLVIGETQISYQIKEAYQSAIGHGTVGKDLHRLVQRALGVAKRVRTDTAISEHPLSVSYAAVVLAQRIFGSLSGRKILLVGAGEMGELACRHFRERGAEIWITNRTFSRAEELAKEFSGTPLLFSDFLGSSESGKLDHFDVILTSAGAEKPFLTREMLAHAMEHRKNRAMFIIDIAVPRNVDPAVDTLDNLFLYNIDDLQGVVKSGLEARERELQKGEEIIHEEVEKVLAEFRSDDVGPNIQELKEKAEKIRQDEIEKHIGPGFSPEQKEIIEACTRAIINKVLHDPIIALKRLFRLE